MSLSAGLRKAFDQGVGTVGAGRHVALISTGGGRASTGENITAERAMTFATYFAAVRVLSESIAQLPLITYRRLPGGGKERATDHHLYPVLHDRANPSMTSFAWRESNMSHVCTWGNGYAAIGRDGLGRVRELWPMAADRMLDVWRTPDGALRYRYQTLEGKVVELTSRDVFHVAGLMWDGVRGYPFLQVAREAVGIGRAIDEYAGRFFEHDARPGVIYTHPKTLSDTARRHLEESVAANHEGVGNAWRFSVLEEGMTVTAIPTADAQFLEAARWQRGQIATLTRIPPHMLGDLDKATFSNIEHQSLEFVTYTLGPWLARWEAAIGMQLLGPDWVGAGGDYFTEFLVDGFLRGDAAARFAAYHTARMDGWLSADEIRERENMNPLPGGTGAAYWRPLNITAVGPDGTVTTTTIDTGAGGTTTTGGQS